MASSEAVLVCSHDDATSALLADVLAACGHRILRARSSAEALVTLGREPVELLVADVELPGTGFAELIRARSEDAIRADVISVRRRGRSSSPFDARAMAHVQALVELPLGSASELVLPVRHVLERRRLAAENARLAVYLQQADRQVDTLNAELALLSTERARQREHLAQASSQIDRMNVELSRFVIERGRQLEYLAQANTQVDAMNRELEVLMRERNRQLDYLSQANTQIEEFTQKLDEQVAERTRQLQEANRALEELSLTDDVTGLYNQRWLKARLEDEFQRARENGYDLSLLMIDVDNFKQVNDTNDHLFGSQALKGVGAMLRGAVRGIDVAVRYGGDEFVVILPDTTLAAAAAVADRLRVSVSKTNVGDEKTQYFVTLSIGVASSKTCGCDTSTGLLQAADHALYEAKELGRNRVAFKNGANVMTVAS